MDNLTATISPLVIDLVLAMIVLLVAFIKAKSGLYQSVMSVVVVILAIAMGFVGARLFEEPVSGYVWEKYSPKVEAKFDEKVQAALDNKESLGQAFQNSWNRVVQELGSEKLSDSLSIEQEEVDYNDSELVQKLRQLTLLKTKMLVDKVCHLALFGVCTALALLLLTLVKNFIGDIANFSVIGWVNRFGGFCLGFVEAIVVMLLIVRGAGLLNINYFANLSEGTVLLSWLVGGDVQATIKQVQELSLKDIKKIKLEDLTTVDFNDVSDQLKELIESTDFTQEASEFAGELAEEIDADAIVDAVGDAVEGAAGKAEDGADKVKDATDKVKKVKGIFDKLAGGSSDAEEGGN